MSDETMNELIKRARELSEAAKAGPWEWEADDATMLCLGTKGDACLEGHVLSAWRCESCAERDAKCLWPSKENSDFIAESRTLVPALADALEAAERREAVAVELAAQAEAHRERLIDEMCAWRSFCGCEDPEPHGIECFRCGYPIEGDFRARLRGL